MFAIVQEKKKKRSVGVKTIAKDDSDDEDQNKSFVCHRCSRAFKDKQHLSDHMSTPHDPDAIPGSRSINFAEIKAAAMRPLVLVCSQCQAHFGDPDILNLHESLHKNDVSAIRTVLDLVNTLPPGYSVSLNQNSE